MPGDIRDAIGAHLLAAHAIPVLDLAEVGKTGSRSKTLLVVWHDGDEWTDAWFDCRRCPAGFDRYLVDVDRDQPTHRILPLIAAHFDCAHPPFRGVEDLGTRLQPRSDQLALYVPPHAEAGASLLCQTCKPVGRNPIMLTTPPFGDARRLYVVKRRHPELGMRMLAWSSTNQAAYLRALDEGRLDPTPADARNALRPPQALATDLPILHQALLALLIARTTGGVGIDAVITELDVLSREDPTAFACQVAEGLVELGLITDHPGRAHDLAEHVRLTLGLPVGQYPKTSKPTLYRLWRRR